MLFMIGHGPTTPAPGQPPDVTNRLTEWRGSSGKTEVAEPVFLSSAVLDASATGNLVCRAPGGLSARFDNTAADIRGIAPSAERRQTQETMPIEQSMRRRIQILGAKQ